MLADHHGMMRAFHEGVGKIAAKKGPSLPSQGEPNERGDLSRYRMKALLSAPTEHLLLTEPAKPFSIVVVFDDLAARQKAVQVYSRILRHFGDDFDFECNLWPFDELGPHGRGQEAAGVAASADMIVFASTNETLPDAIKLWIEMWLAKKGSQETSVVAMIGTPNSQERPSTPGHVYLETVSRQTGMSYFAGQFQAPKPMPACSIAAIVARASALTPVLDEILHHQAPPPVRWGINE